MPQKRHLIGAIGLAVVGSLVGCVPAEQYEAMKMKADQYAAQLGEAQSSITAANNRADLNEKELQNRNSQDSSQTALLTNLQQQNSDLAKQNADFNEKYQNAMRTAATLGNQTALPTPLSSELSDFAAKNADVIDFDAGRGVVRFKSDVTFPAGDSAVTSSAKPVLTKFATILNSGGAEGYELLVAGHTDSTPVTNAKTIKMGNFDNWYLSSHRAIAVGKELIADGVSAKRLGMVGYADERPVASNATESGKAQNRRVEVLILPTTARSSSFGGGSTASAVSTHSHHSRTAAAVPAAATLNKDSGSAVPAPALAPVMTK